MAILLKTQRNEVLRTIARAEMDPERFGWSTINDPNHGEGEYICFDPKPDGTSEYWFRFGVTRDHWAPGLVSTRDHSDIHFGWESRLRRVGNWLEYLKRETQAVDLWAAVAGIQASTSPRLPNAAESTSWRPGETDHMRQLLLQFAGTLGERLDAAKIPDLHTSITDLRNSVHELQAELRDLAEKIEGSEKKDWIRLAIGTVISYGLSSALPFPVVSHYLSQLVSLFNTPQLAK